MIQSYFGIARDCVYFRGMREEGPWDEGSVPWFDRGVAKMVSPYLSIGSVSVSWSDEAGTFVVRNGREVRELEKKKINGVWYYAFKGGWIWEVWE